MPSPSSLKSFPGTVHNSSFPFLPFLFSFLVSYFFYFYILHFLFRFLVHGFAWYWVCLFIIDIAATVQKHLQLLPMAL